MNKPITKVLRSKSSNSTITMKTDKRRNKTTKSNADFQTNDVKKRGVYVDNKHENLNINVQVATRLNKFTKSPSRPRPDKRCFLTSVLKILSKSTIGTQHPNVEDNTEETKKIETIKDTNKNKVNNRNETTDRIKQKRKYKSRVLNRKRDYKLVTLQAKKQILTTPSIYSEQSHACVNNLHKSSALMENTINQDVTTTKKNFTREVLEGEQRRNKKVRIDNDPSTLVADVNNKDDKGLYTLFVDLLETTFSIYNLKAQYNRMNADDRTSKTNLEIRQSVAERLNIYTHESNNSLNKKLSKNFNGISNVQENWYDNDFIKTIIDNPHTTVKEEPFKTKRNSNKKYDYSKRLLMKAKSDRVTSKRKLKRASRKQSLLNSLKEQLRMEAKVYEEPENIYIALKSIARNKRRYERSIRFHQSYKDGVDKCRMNRRKVISTSTRSNPKKLASENEVLRQTRKINTSTYPQIPTQFDAESHHSLQVYGFVDVPNITKRQGCDNN